LELAGHLRNDAARRFQLLAAGPPELDIVVWKLSAETPEMASQLAQQVFAACATRDLHLALVELPLAWFGPAAGVNRGDSETAGTVTCLRSVLMKPEHLAWLDRIWDIFSASCAEVLGE
jgi:hypothetical protein